MFGRRFKNWLSVAFALLVGGGALSVAWSAGEAGQDEGQRLRVDMPAQELSVSLTQLGREWQTDVAFSPEAVKEKRAPAVRGEFGRGEALGRLLEGTGLTWRETAQGAIVVEPVRAASRAKVSEGEGSAAGETGGADGNGAGAPKTEEGTKLEEIVVTAQRREERVTQVPMSIDALSQKTMDELHIVKLEDLMSVVPGLLAKQSPGATIQDGGGITIRGIGTFFNSPVNQVYIDETPVAIRVLPSGVAMTPQPYIFDLDHVEVLRGPQGTLFGASAMGGALRFLTPQPNLHQYSGLTKAEVGVTDHGDPDYEVGAALGGPIVADKLGFRISGWRESLGGFIDREDPFTGQTLKVNANSSDAYVVRSALAWQPTDALTITPAFFLQQRTSANPDSYWFGVPSPEPNGRLAYGGLPQPLYDAMRVGSLAIKYNFSRMTFQSDTSYLDRRAHATTDFTQILESIFANGFAGGPPFIAGLDNNFWPFTDNSVTRSWQQEFRLTSADDPDARISWVAGLFYRHQLTRLRQEVFNDLSPLTEALYDASSMDLFRVPNYTFNGQVLNAFQDDQATDISKAIFGDVTLKITPRLKAELGLRIERTQLQDQVYITAGPLNGVTYDRTVLPDQEGTPVTPRASLTYQYTDTDMVYASAAKGFRGGGSNTPAILGNTGCGQSLALLGLTSVPKTYGSDKLWNYEVGTKNLLFDRRLSIEGSVFYMDWTDIQSGIYLPSCFGGFTGNRGKVISEGFDLQVDSQITRGLKIGAAVGYTDAYYPDASYQLPAPGATTPPVQLNGAGEKFNAIPWTASVNLQYTWDSQRLWPDSHPYLRLDSRWQDANVPTLVPQDRSYSQLAALHPDPPYNILNVRLGVLRGGLDISAYVYNVTNAHPNLTWNHWGNPSVISPGDLFTQEALRPRTIGLSAWYHF